MVYQECTGSATSRYLKKCLSIGQYAVLTRRGLHGHCAINVHGAMHGVPCPVAQNGKRIWRWGGGGEKGGRTQGPGLLLECCWTLILIADGVEGGGGKGGGGGGGGGNREQYQGERFCCSRIVGNKEGDRDA